MLLLILALTSSWDLSFPGSNQGNFDARYFFQPDADQFIYAAIEDDVGLVKYGPVTFGIGLGVETFMGQSDKDGDTAFNVYGAHWNIRGIVDVDYRDLIFSLFTDHECYHNIDMADTCGQYMNNLKLGVRNRTNPLMVDRTVFMPAGWIPEYDLSVGIYRPQNASFQKGHIFDWSLHSVLDYPVVSAGEMLYGTLLHSDFYFHTDGGGSSRHYVEVYADHPSGHEKMGIFFRHHFHDTQPIRSLEGETCFGIRFRW